MTANADLIKGRSVAATLTNKSGGSVAKGDVVIIDTGNDTAFTTTTSGRTEVSIGVVLEENGIANNASGRVLLAGHAPLINVPASVTRGHYLETHTVAKQATGSATRRSGSFGQFLTGGTTPTAWLWGSTDQSATAAAGAGSILAETYYQPGSNNTYTKNNTTNADVDATNLVVTFTVPASGAVWVEMEALCDGSTSDYGIWGLRAAAADVANSYEAVFASNHTARRRYRKKMSGLTPGASLTWKWAWRSASSITQHIYVGPVSDSATFFGAGWMCVTAAL